MLIDATLRYVMLCYAAPVSTGQGEESACVAAF